MATYRLGWQEQRAGDEAQSLLQLRVHRDRCMDARNQPADTVLQAERLAFMDVVPQESRICVCLGAGRSCLLQTPQA